MEPIHAQILDAARAKAGHNWTFRIADVIASLPHLNPATVRTHIASRCCANAPPNHQTRYRYFRALERGTYRVEPAFRRRPRRRPRPWQDIVLSLLDSGVDSTLIAESLRMSPTGRLEMMRRAAGALEAFRR